MESLSALQLLSRRPRIDEPEAWTSDRAGRSGRPLALLRVAVGEKRNLTAARLRHAVTVNRCEQCGFVYESLALGDVGSTIRSLAH